MKPKEEDPKEMVGGCCVCSDENGWTENPLVYCDGQSCNVAVHQACYGIVTVPTGAWFCRKCESQERAARVRCELCPAKDGALKRTDSGGWAHVVCALYIPEVRFGNVTTMEPIVLELIPQERFNKICYLCEESSKGSSAKSQTGACMQCNRQGCKNNFHVTCAQTHGLLCEEAGNYLDNVKYCGYCSYHYNKLRGSQVKTIPPYRPVPPDQTSSDDDKNTGISLNSSESAINDSEPKDSKHKKRSSKYSSNFDIVKGSRESSSSKSHSDSGSSKSHSDSGSSKHNSSASSDEQNSVISDLKSSAISNSVSSSNHNNKSDSKTNSINSDSKTNNSSCSVVPNNIKTNNSSSSVAPNNIKPNDSSGVKSTTTSPSVKSEGSSATLKSSSSSNCNNVTSAPLSSNTQSSSSTAVSTTQSTSATTVTTSQSISTSVVSESISSSSSNSSSTRGSKLLNSSSLPPSSQESNQTLAPDSSTTTMDREKDKQRKLRRNNGNSKAPLPSLTAQAVPKDVDGDVRMSTEEESPSKEPQTLKIWEEKNLSSSDVREKSSSTKVKSCPPEEPKLNVQFTPNVSSHTSRTDKPNDLNDEPEVGEPVKMPRSSSQDRGARRTSKRGSGGGSSLSSSSKRGRTMKNTSSSRDSGGGSSPESMTSEAMPVSKRARAKKLETKETLSTITSSVITNGVVANTLLLGNQINPSSAVAQSMADTLHAELEAHSIYKDEEAKSVTGLVGPALPGKRETSTPGSSVLNNNQPPPLPQSLEQLLERQWEQGSQFLMEQAQHFDIASLLSCLHQLRQENVRLEETVNSLVTRRDHLLAVNARLSVPLASGGSSSSSVSGSGQPPVGSTSHASSLTSHATSMVSITPTVAPPPPPPSHTHQSPSGGASHHPQSTASRSLPQGRHPSGGGAHPSMPPTPSGRGASPHDRRGGPHQVPLENGLGEPEYRYRSPGSEQHQHRQQSPMLPPGAQPSPTSLRQSPASVNYHSGTSPLAGVPSLSPSSSHSLGSHSLVSGGGHPPVMVSSSHNVSLSRGSSDHSRAELVRLSSAAQQPPGPPHGGGYPVYQMVSPPVPGPHHSPVTMQQHPSQHPTMIRRGEPIDSGRGSHSSMDKR